MEIYQTKKSNKFTVLKTTRLKNIHQVIPPLATSWTEYILPRLWKRYPRGQHVKPIGIHNTTLILGRIQCTPKVKQAKEAVKKRILNCNDPLWSFLMFFVNTSVHLQFSTWRVKIFFCSHMPGIKLTISIKNTIKLQSPRTCLFSIGRELTAWKIANLSQI